MKAKELIREISKARRFLPANLDKIDVEIVENNFNKLTFYFIKEGEILHKFNLNRHGDD